MVYHHTLKGDIVLARVFAVANQKGGVGKTTSCINIAASLALAKCRVLLIDLDPQGNATTGSGVDKSTLSYSINDVLLGNVSISESVIKNTAGGYDVIGASQELTQAEVKLLETPHRERCLRLYLASLLTHYDYILFDCPPSLNMLTLNGLVAADGVIIAMQCEYYALEGLSALVNTIHSIKRTANPYLQIEGILRTMYDPRNRLAGDVSEQLQAHFGDKLYKTLIPRNIRLAEAPSHGLPIVCYDNQSRGAIAYQELANEILQQHETSKRVQTA